MTDNLPEHSPLGGSSAERWMKCPGSVALNDEIMAKGSPYGIFVPEEPEYRAEGSCAHEAAAHALTHGKEAWELVGMEFCKCKVTAEMADDIEVYLRYIGTLWATDVHKVEQKFHRPDLHKWYYGTTDFECSYIGTGNFDGNQVKPVILEVVDFKFGIGIVKEAEWNPQLMYYAFGRLNDYEDVDIVRLTIVQPRAFHQKGAIRSWDVWVKDLEKWGNEVLLPAMEAAEWDKTLNPGDEQCRFCNAKLACPAINKSLEVVRKANPDLANYDIHTLTSLYVEFPKVKMLMKAVEEAIYTAASRGQTDSRIKLVASRSDRIWKDGAMEAARQKWDSELIFTKPEFVSPAQLDKACGPEGKAFTKEHAYTPFKGTTLALADDKRPAIKARSASDTFAAAVDTLEIPEFLNRAKA